VLLELEEDDELLDVDALELDEEELEEEELDDWPLPPQAVSKINSVKSASRFAVVFFIVIPPSLRGCHRQRY